MKKTRRSYNSTLKKTKGIKRVSDDQKKELALRAKVKKLLIFMFGDKKCMICHKRPDFRGLSLSHKIPLARGGKTDVFNCELACGKCHAKEHGIKESDA